MPRFAIAATLLSSFLALGTQAHPSSPECALKTNEAINGLAKDAFGKFPQWNTYQQNSIKDAFLAARRVKWDELNGSGAANLAQIAKIRQADDLEQAKIYADIAKDKTTDSIAKQKAGADANYWWTLAKIDASPLRFSSCYWAPKRKTEDAGQN